MPEKWYRKWVTVDNIGLGTGSNLQKVKFVLSDASLKSHNIFGKHINGISETSTTREYVYIISLRK